jgi:pyruvate formate lyase activating enzyme
MHAWEGLRGIQPVSLCDWPGKVTAVLFVGGCPWRCPTCHNATLAWQPHRLPPLPRDEVLTFLERRKIWLDGVVVSGGEPSCLPGLELVLQDIAHLGYPVKLDTNGVHPERVDSWLTAGLVEAVAVDVKGPWERYPELTGGRVDPQTAKAKLSRFFAVAAARPHQVMFRCTKVPSLTPQDLETVRQQVPETFPLFWQDYVPARQTSNEMDYASADSQT